MISLVQELGKLARRVGGPQLTPRVSDQEDRRRECALNALLVTSILLAVLPGAQRVVQISRGGPETADHVETLAVVSVAALAYGLLLWLSHRGQRAAAARGLLIVYFGVAVWLLLSEGPQKGVTILACSLLVVAAGVLCGSQAAGMAAVATTVALVGITVLESVEVVGAPTETIPRVLDTVSIIEIVVAFGAIALLLSSRTREHSGLDKVGARLSTPLHAHRTGDLSVREMQVVGLLARGQANADIAAALMVSPRTVHSHVSSALRKTGCSNRTELAVLAIREGLGPPGEA